MGTEPIGRIVRLNFIRAAAHHGFRRPVFVDQSRCRSGLPPQEQALGHQVLPADDEDFRRARRLFRFDLLIQQFQVRRSDFDQAAIFPTPQGLHQALPAPSLGKNLDPPSGQQWGYKPVTVRSKEIEVCTGTEPPACTEYDLTAQVR